MADFSRRGFLGLLAAAVPALLVKPDALWMPDGLSTTPLDDKAIYSFEALVREFAERLDQHFGRNFDFVGKRSLGSHGLVHQCDIALELPSNIDHHGLDGARFVNPMVAAMSQHIGPRPAVFGQLEIPESGVMRGVSVTLPSGLSVRGVQCYDVSWDSLVTRIDCLYG